MSKQVANNKYLTGDEVPNSRFGACRNCGAAVEQFQLAFSIEAFCVATSLSRAFVYEQIAAGCLRTAKAGTRTIILYRDAMSFLDCLPAGRGMARPP